MQRALFPAASVPRPALAILQEVFEGARRVSFRELQERLDAPRTTLTRNLGALVDASLAYREQRDRYILPRPSTLGLLLVEPDAYARNLLLHEDALPELGISQWAYACLPVRRALSFDLLNAVPVVSPKLTRVDPSPSPTIVWHDYDPESVQTASVQFPSWAKHDPGATQRGLKTLPAKDALALFAATGDSRLIEAAAQASKKLHVKRESLASAARRLVIEPPSRKLRYPNSVILPKWLLQFAHTARAVSAKERIARDLLGSEDE